MDLCHIKYNLVYYIKTFSPARADIVKPCLKINKSTSNLEVRKYRSIGSPWGEYSVHLKQDISF